jgi:hypothetical protein
MKQIEISEGFFRRSMIASAVVGLLGGLFAAVYAGPALAGRYLLFLGWMLVNLMIWSVSLREFLGPRRPLVLVPLAAAKVFWLAALFVLCYFVGISGTARLSAFLLGFNTPFLVMLLKVLGAALMRERLGRGARELL